MPKQSTGHILMVRPAAFRLNEQTAVNNYYQPALSMLSNEAAHTAALKEFDNLVQLLRANRVKVTVVQDTASPSTPDAVFPNNVFSFHDGGICVSYSMYAANRREERKLNLPSLLATEGINYTQHVDFSSHEKNNKFLEGTGSMVLDRVNKIAYASLSERTDAHLVKEFGERMGYEIVLFHATQMVGEERKPIYHTNVMLSIGSSFAVLCEDCITDENEKQRVKESLMRTGHEVVLINERQVENFAGNVLEVLNSEEEKLIVMSSRAFNSLDSEQKIRLTGCGRLLHTNLQTIETLGGGSARCMMAEVFS